MTRELLNVKQVQDILHLSERTVFRLIKTGELKGMKIGREWRFEPSDIDAFLSLQREKAQVEIEKLQRQAQEKNAA